MNRSLLCNAGTENARGVNGPLLHWTGQHAGSKTLLLVLVGRREHFLRHEPKGVLTAASRRTCSPRPLRAARIYFPQ